MKYHIACVPMKGVTKPISILNEELISRIEIQERSLQTYSKEIFENIGQVLSLVKLQITDLQIKNEATCTTMSDSGKLLGKAIGDLRNLTKQLSPDEILQRGFASGIYYELKRLSDAGFCTINFLLTGEVAVLEDVQQLVVFCILQRLTYPVMDIYHPGRIDMRIYFNADNVGIEIIRKFRGELLILESEEREKLNCRLKWINGSVGYGSVDNTTLQITINI